MEIWNEFIWHHDLMNDLHERVELGDVVRLNFENFRHVSQASSHFQLKERLPVEVSECQTC